MKTRYTIQYWYIDEHDFLECDFNTLPQAIRFASQLDHTIYKDILIYARHWQSINEPFEYDGIVYNDFKWRLIDDDFIQYYDNNGILQAN